MHKTLLTAFSNSSSDNLKSKIENRKLVGLITLVIAFALCGARAGAQQPKKIPRIGFLSAVDQAVASTRFELFRLALRELGTWLQGLAFLSRQFFNRHSGNLWLRIERLKEFDTVDDNRDK